MGCFISRPTGQEMLDKSGQTVQPVNVVTSPARTPIATASPSPKMPGQHSSQGVVPSQVRQSSVRSEVESFHRSSSLPFEYLVRDENGELQPTSRQGAYGQPVYRIIRKIGEGGFAEIYLAEHMQRRIKVAIKFMDRGKGVANVRREIENHSNLSHPQVVQFKEVFLMPQLVGLVMEYIPGGDLFHYLSKHGRLDESQARWVFQQEEPHLSTASLLELTVAVNYCHQHGVINRDLKPENTLVLEEGRPVGKPLIKICDFGYSKKLDIESLAITKVGTPGYIAPEVLQPTHAEAHGEPVDYWSLGCILYVMLFRRYPFLDKEDMQTSQFSRTTSRILRGDYRFPLAPAISDECKNLIRGLLVVDPSQRMGLKQLLADPWFITDLPRGAFPQTMPGSPNSVIRKRTAYQTPEEITDILTRALRRSMPAAAS